MLEQQSKALQNQPQRDLFALLPLLNSWWICRKAMPSTLTTRRFPAAWGFIAGMTSAMPRSLCIRRRWIRCCCPPWQCTLPRLRNDNGSDVEYSYEALKAYQMLYQPKHYDGKFLHSWVMLNLQRNLPQNVTQAQLQELEWHLTQLLEPKFRLHRMRRMRIWSHVKGRSSTSSRSQHAYMAA